MEQTTFTKSHRNVDEPPTKVNDLTTAEDSKKLRILMRTPRERRESTE
jgi:hypothetical protein